MLLNSKNVHLKIFERDIFTLHVCLFKVNIAKTVDRFSGLAIFTCRIEQDRCGLLSLISIPSKEINIPSTQTLLLQGVSNSSEETSQELPRVTASLKDSVYVLTSLLMYCNRDTFLTFIRLLKVNIVNDRIASFPENDTVRMLVGYTIE